MTMVLGPGRGRRNGGVWAAGESAERDRRRGVGRMWARTGLTGVVRNCFGQRDDGCGVHRQVAEGHADGEGRLAVAFQSIVCAGAGMSRRRWKPIRRATEYCFERGAAKDSGTGDGWADVWKRGKFAWEYKSQGKDLDAAFQQLRQYALALENPPLADRLRHAGASGFTPTGRTASARFTSSICTSWKIRGHVEPAEVGVQRPGTVAGRSRRGRR